MEVIELKNKVEIFSYNVDIKKNAYMNWRIHIDEKGYNLYVVAQGYAKASNILIENVLYDNTDKRADIIIFPILYSINQAIELYEKSILVILKKIAKEEYNIPTTHDIRKLFNDMIKFIGENKKSMQGLNKRVEILKDYIDNLYSYIVVNGKAEMDFSRYPLNSKGNNFFYIEDNNNVVVDIENLQKILNEIVDVLEGFALMFLKELEYTE